MKTLLNILNQEIGYGRTKLNLDIAKLHTGTRLEVPVIIERSKKPGPTLLLIAGIHGNEVNGVEIVRQIISAKYNKPTCGTVICIPVVNVFGFLNQKRQFPDGRDLNRVFPGSKKGSLASRFAYAIMQHIVPVVDYIIDYHTGGDSRFNYSQIRIDKNDNECLELAKIFGSRFILHSKNRDKSFRKSATDLGKKVLLFEGGRSLYLDKMVTKSAIEGTLKVMHHLKIRDFEEEISTMPTEENHHIITKSVWLRANRSGMYRKIPRLGQYVEKGQLIGTISDPYGNFEKPVKATTNGFIICSNQASLVNQGDALVHIGITED
ncbi:MAG: succinylglutamate desuccinylase/aspartoacylase family protein [Bacteroidia bacterium]|nr:succinylglutamate desuccinylase/aspartoacylase family protein [Bacteroidia bacterium]